MNEELKIIISAEINKLRTELQKGKKEVEGFSKKSKASLQDYNDAIQKVGNVSKQSLKVAAGAIAGLTVAFLALVPATKEYRESQAKLNTAFKVAGGSAEDAKKTYNDLYRVLGDTGQATEAAQHLAKLTTEEKSLSEWTDICKGVYATFGSSLPIESLAEAANETAQTGEITGALADALNWAGVSEDEFAESLFWCNNAAEREQLIRRTLNGIYSEAGEQYETTASSILDQNEAQNRLNEAMAQMAEVATPIMAMLTELGAEILTQLTPHIKDFADKHLPGIKESLSEVGDKVGVVINWIADHWELVTTLAAIIAGIATAISILSTAMTIATVVQTAFSASMLPITITVLAIVAAIAVLVAIVVLVIKYWDEIKAATKKCWDAIVEAIQIAIDWIVNLFKNIINWVKENWQGLLLLLVNPFAGAFKLIYDNCEGFRNTIDNLVQKISGFFKKMWDGLKTGAKNAWDGVKSTFSKVADFFGNIFSNAWAKVKGVFSAGGEIFSGIKEGIERTFKTVVNKLISGINTIISVPFKAINNALSKIKSIEIVGIKPFNWIKTFDIPKIPQLERGGVLAKGQVGLLEGNGSEAVVPLERNLGWLDKLAEMLTDKMGGGTPVVLQVDGKTWAQATINAVNNRTKQTGKLDLILA